MVRLLPALILCAALVPGVVVRDSPSPPGAGVVGFEPVPHPPAVAAGSPMRIAGAWRLDSAAPEFGGYSALATLADGRLAAFSDRGTYLVFAPPDAGELRPAPIRFLANRRGTASKRERDCEAVTYDRASGTIWAAYEQTNAIVRLSPGMVERARARPRLMRDWPANRGPEAMVRLADGRFIILAETENEHGRNPGLLFAGPPDTGARALRFAYRPPAGYRPTDIAQLPDGRVLVLNREYRFPWRFSAAIVLADPRAIVAGRTWRGREVARLSSAVPLDNYEGLAVADAGHGEVAIWLISDDNGARMVQRTLLLKLAWNPKDDPRAGDRPT